MKENTVIWNEYSPEKEVALPAKWIMVAENLLDESQYKEWLFYAMRYMGFAGIGTSTDTVVNMILRATYEEDEEFFDRYYKSIIKDKISTEDLLKVSKIWKKEDQLNAYRNRNETC